MRVSLLQETFNRSTKRIRPIVCRHPNFEDWLTHWNSAVSVLRQLALPQNQHVNTLRSVPVGAPALFAIAAENGRAPVILLRTSFFELPPQYSQPSKIQTS